MKAIGAMNQLVTIQKRTEVSDGQGIVATYSTRGTAYANIQPTTGRESVQAGQMVSASSSTFVTYFRDDISIKDRLVRVANGITRTFEILAIGDPNGMRENLEIIAVEVDS